MKLTPWKSIFKESSIEEAKKVDGYESPEPGNLPKEKADVLAKTYASCRKDNKDKTKCAKIAWSQAKK